MYLTVDLPSQPLFRDDQRENIIPQVIQELLIITLSRLFVSFVVASATDLLLAGTQLEKNSILDS